MTQIMNNSVHLTTGMEARIIKSQSDMCDIARNNGIVCMDPGCSRPEDEPWYKGPPSFAYYTRVYIPNHYSDNEIRRRYFVGLKDLTRVSGAHYMWVNMKDLRNPYIEIWSHKDNIDFVKMLVSCYVNVCSR